MKELLLALVGNPNAGKTTLFNRLTGARETVGNRPGVTVEVKEREWRGGGAWLADLPGIYSLTPASEEEAIAAAYLRQARPDVIVNIVDAVQLERNLYLTMQLLELGVPVVVALNMMDEAKRRGVYIDTHRLSEALGVPVLPITARTGAGVPALRTACLHPKRWRTVIPPAMPETRYRRIAELMLTSVRRRPRGRTRSDRIDAVLTCGRFGIPVFLAVMSLVFILTFDTLGAWLSDGVETMLLGAERGIETLLMQVSAPDWLIAFLADGVLAGVGGVAAFLPQIALLFFFLSLLEDSGYMARTAFLADRPLRRFGLSGRAVIPMLMGFGCTVPAALAARTLPGRAERRNAILLLPFMSCSAKLPVYALMTAAFFPRHRGLVMLGLYVMGVSGGLMTAALMGGRGGKTGFVIELPPYRLPRLSNTLLFAAERVRHFLYRAGSVILLMSIILWLLTNFSFDFAMVASPRDSMLAAIGEVAAPFFRPLGFGFWQAAVALLTGLVAKEAVVSTLLLLCAAEGSAIGEMFSPAGALAFLTFVLLYAPCAAAMATMRRELGGWGWALLSAVYQTLLAFIAAGAVYIAAGFLFAG